MKLYMRRIDQGQIVEVAYGYHEGRAYRRTVDQGEPFGSPWRETWCCADIDWDREPDHEDHDREPCIDGDWTPCDEPRDD
jgi:hypothetical protein